MILSLHTCFKFRCSGSNSRIPGESHERDANFDATRDGFREVTKQENKERDVLTFQYATRCKPLALTEMFQNLRAGPK